MTHRKTLEDLANKIRYVKEELDYFLDHHQPNWGYFDGELGSIHRNSTLRGGIDDSLVCYTYVPNGPRLMVNHSGSECRINTYGDSFTDGACVNDGETWQEVLAARLGEPVRNFGVGGYSSYQAYRRMVRMEKTDYKVPYLILNIYMEDDNYRNIDLFRWVRWHVYMDRKPGKKFRMHHANPCCHLRFNPEQADFEEAENPCPTPESLYQLTDPDFVFHFLENDLTTQIILAQNGYTVHNIDLLRRTAESLNLPLSFKDRNKCKEAASTLHWEVGLRSAIHVVKLWRQFCQREKRRYLIATCYDVELLGLQLRGKKRADQLLIDWIKNERIPLFDAGASHTIDFKLYRCDPKTYMDQYYIGHYNPRGNFFFASGMKEELLKVLDPKPILYDEKRALNSTVPLIHGCNFAL